MRKYLSIFEVALFYLVVTILIFIPLYPKFPFINIPGTFVAIRAEDVLIALFLGFWICYLLLSKNIAFLWKNRLMQALWLFFAVGALSSFSGVFLTHTVTVHLTVFHLLRRVELMLLLPFALISVTQKRHLKILFNTLVVVTVLVDVYAFGEKYLHWPVISTTNSEFSKGLILYLTPGARVNSTFAGHYDLAVYLVMFLVLSTPLIFLIKNWLQRALLAGVMLISFIVLIMTAARLSFAAVIIGIFLSLLLSGKKLFIFLFLIATVVVLVYPSQLRDRLVSTVRVNIEHQVNGYQSQNQEQLQRSQLNIPTLVFPDASHSGFIPGANQGAVASDITPGEPTDTTDLGVYRSFGIRINYEWPAAMRAFYKNVFLGSGYSSLGLAADNDFLRSLGEVGLLGTIALGLVFAEIFKRLYRSWRSKTKLKKYIAVGMISMVIAFLTNGLFIDVLESSKVASLFWLFVGISLSPAVERL